MKKVVNIFLLGALFIVTLTSCVQSDISEHEKLLGEFKSLEEFEFNVEGTILIEASFFENFTQSLFNPAQIDEAEAMLMLEVQAMFQTIFPMHVFIDGTVSMEHREMWSELTQYSDMTAEPIVTMETLITEDAMYTDLSATLHSVYLWLESMIYDMADAFDEEYSEEDIQIMLSGISTSFDNAFGGYTHLRTPLTQTGVDTFYEAVISPTSIFEGIDASPFLEREDDVFTITITAEDVLESVEDIEDILIRLLTGGVGFPDNGEAVDDVMKGMIETLLAQIDELGESTLANTSIEKSLLRKNDEFHQSIIISIPGLLTITQNTLYKSRFAPPIGIPTQALTIEEMERRLMEVIMDIDR